MNQGEAIAISSADDDDDHYIDRRSVLEPVIHGVVDALGGYEQGTYRLGDEASRCLQDLKKLWRKDDTDDERTVARIFWETRVLTNDLVPILLMTAGKGLVEDKRAIACVDLMAAMTWPIDLAEELKELDEELDKGTDYTQLLLSHLNYKAALLKPGVMQALFGIVLPPLSKHPKDRVARDGQIVHVVLHLIRNLAFIKDLPPNMHLSADQAEYSSLQTRLVNALSETRTFELLLTLSANASNDLLFNSWNTLILEIFYLLFRGAKPSCLAVEQAKQSTESLHRLLAKEERLRRDNARTAPSRHSRFGTTIAISLNPNNPRRNDDNDQNQADVDPATSQALILHRQRALNREAGSVMDMAKRQKTKKANKIDELAREDNLSIEAKVVLQNLAKEFIGCCFNSFLSALLKDIKSERPKITEKDHLRLLYVTKWFLDFFLCLRSQEMSKDGEGKWGFGLIAEVMERGWIIWVLKRMREAVEEKPKLWIEVQAGIECLTQLLLLIDSMSSAQIADPTLREAADVLKEQLIYNGEVLDIALESLRSYKDGTQSLTYLDSGVFLAYSLLRMLERWDKTRGGDMYVRKKKTKRRKTNGPGSQEDGVPDVEEGESDGPDGVIHEAMFSFEAFEMKFAHPEIAHTLLTYLARYKDFASVESMKRVVGLLHRQAVKAKAEGLFFKVSTLELFKSILADQKSFPREQPYKDLVNLINFILRKFFKALADEPFLAVEAFFPKNRGQWKQFSSWEPEKAKKDRQIDTRDVQIKKGYSWSDQLGIAIALLVEKGKLELVNWTKDILMLVIQKRQGIIDETDETDTTEGVNETPKLSGPSSEVLAKFTDHAILYANNEQVEAARDPQMKLLFRLVKFLPRNKEQDDDEDPEWYVPASIAPSDLKRVLVVINQFLETPYDLRGKKVSELLIKRRRRRRLPATDLPDDDEPWRKKHEKKKKEQEQYKSATLIEDSDAEYGDIESFLEKEKALRERMSRAAAASGRIGTMKPTGTKKRRKKADKGAGKKQRGNDDSVVLRFDEEDLAEESDSNVSGSQRSSPTANTPVKVKPRPRPRPRPVSSPIREGSIITSDIDGGSRLLESGSKATSEDQSQDNSPFPGVAKKKSRLVLSDDT